MRSKGREKDGASADADRGAAAAQIVENVGDQIAVVGEGLRNPLAQQFALLHP